MARFDGKTVLITGATSGIGRAGALRIAGEGGRLVLTGSTPERVEALRAELPDALVVAGDAAHPGFAERLDEACAGAGVERLDGLWLNAGSAVVGPVETVDAEAFDRLVAVNVRAPFLTLATLSARLAEGASVVVTASSSVYERAGATSLYAATKGALVAAVRGWATQLAPRGVRVNTLVPGAIETDFRRFLTDDERSAFERAVVADTPLGRAGTPHEAAAVALFLLSDDASYVTGAQYAVDGGLVMR